MRQRYRKAILQINGLCVFVNVGNAILIDNIEFIPSRRALSVRHFSEKIPPLLSLLLCAGARGEQPGEPVGDFRPL